MKLARFLAKGRVHQGVYREGLLLDEAGEAHRPEDVTWLLPFTPGKILGVALNYADHAEELGLSRLGLRKKLERYGLDEEQPPG